MESPPRLPPPPTPGAGAARRQARSIGSAESRNEETYRMIDTRTLRRTGLALALGLSLAACAQ
ncbi:hypothetical protein [Roseicella aerolata]|uniref:Uncharacterized protein n=1 Tax=Roseicella aerolata TaxID=2883479 RepID=A0A9X1IHT7_9PROT|nr:hypothetical protein [Roseicella aerolata]MCB4824865.1 hypothetical protein [Roseicella aerolata]